MKKGIITTFFCILVYTVFGQSNTEIAKVYFNKAERAMEKIDYARAKTEFEKGISYLDAITSMAVAEKGAFIYYELKEYEKAKTYAGTYFGLNHNKNSEGYQQMLELYVDMEERLQEKKEKEQKLAAEKKKRELELKKIDSLKTAWNKLSDEFSIEIDDVESFNSSGIAVFSKSGKAGVINDSGEILVQPKTYEKADEFEGFIILKDNASQPSRLYCYNTKDNSSYELPGISAFGANSEYYESVMLPRSNSVLVMYPNNTLEAVVYNLAQEARVKVKNIEEVFKALKKQDIIDKYDEKEHTIKIDKDWYGFGGHLGGEVYALYNLEANKLAGYLFTTASENHFKELSNVGYLGALDRNKLQGAKNGKIVWYNAFGDEVSPLKNSTAQYKGGVKPKEIGAGKYHFIKNNMITKQGKELKSLTEFLRTNK